MSIYCLCYRKALRQRIRVSTQMMYPCFCNLSLRDICSCACELECKYRSRFGGIILPSLVLEGKLLDAPAAPGQQERLLHGLRRP